jgi:hypothetical protein
MTLAPYKAVDGNNDGSEGDHAGEEVAVGDEQNDRRPTCTSPCSYLSARCSGQFIKRV